MMNRTLVRGVVVGIIGGLVASWVKSESEKPLQTIGEELYPPTDEERLIKGADVTNHPENMPPAVLADKVSVLLTGQELTEDEKLEYLQYIHYGMGVFISVVYVEVVDRYEFLAFDRGITAGAFIWLLTHGSTIPALDLQGDVKDMPESWWVWEFGSHIIFGMTLEAIRRISK